MYHMIRILKKIGIALIILIALFIITVILFISFSPQFGGAISKEQKTVYGKSNNYVQGKFVNQQDVKLDLSFGDMRKGLVGFLNPIPNAVPKNDIAVERIDSLDIVNYKDATRLIWFGHSTFLLQMENLTILIDPMFGKVPAPHPMLGVKRFSKELPIEIEKLPKIDAVLISHDHYDHLDYGSIKKLRSKVNKFYVPLGVGVHLSEWGITSNRIIELDWWEDVKLKGVTFTCTPAQHFSGRGLNDRSNTLWSSWVIQSASESLFFSGDSGYGPHFREIGKKYGPFDFAMMECGQYNKLWPGIHMFPEETAQAAVDVNAEIVMPIHWGAFKLGMHSWTDPVERFSTKVKELNLNLMIPKIGQEIQISTDSNHDATWWKMIQ